MIYQSVMTLYYMYNEMEIMKKKLESLETCIEFMPEGTGYQEAKLEFEEHRNK